MSNYSKSTDFASKDTLSPGDPNKIVKGTEIDAEFNAIETAVNSKINTTDIGTTVQAYDADLTTLGAGGAGARSFLGLAAIASSGSASDLSTGTVGTARLGSGTASSTTYLRGDQTWSTVDTTVPIDIQTFNSGDADLTWDKPTGGQTMVKIQVWAGGGGGARGSANTANGGGGGAYNEWVGPLSYMGSTATVTVGAGGVGRTGSTGSGTAGGSSSVAIASYPNGSKTVIAYGGGGGGYAAAALGGGGGGLLGAGQTATNSPGTTYGGKGYQSAKSSSYAPDMSFFSYNADPTAGGNGNRPNGCGYSEANGGVYGGGGGGGAQDLSSYGGGNSMYGGGGGACGNTAGAGTSLYGGNGGANAAGTVPSGGGGSSPLANVNGSNGAAGRVVITSW